MTKYHSRNKIVANHIFEKAGEELLEADRTKGIPKKVDLYKSSGRRSIDSIMWVMDGETVNWEHPVNPDDLIYAFNEDLEYPIRIILESGRTVESQETIQEIENAAWELYETAKNARTE